MIKMDESIRAIFFRQVTATSNWMAAINATADGSHEYLWRMRHEIGSPGEYSWSNTEKNWYRGSTKIKLSLDDALVRIRFMMALLDEYSLGPVHELIRGDMTVEEFGQELSRQPWVKTTVLPKGGNA